MWGSGVISPPFVNSALGGADWLASGPGSFTIDTYWIGVLVVPRIGLDTIEKINILPLPCRPARSLSLYRLLFWETKLKSYCDD
jgi:hypothetical protein